MWIVIARDRFNAVDYYGPFPNQDAAVQYAQAAEAMQTYREVHVAPIIRAHYYHYRLRRKA